MALAHLIANTKSTSPVTEEKLHREASEWLAKKENAEAISDIIDNPENTEIRELIIAKKYQEAAKLAMEILNEREPAKVIA